MKSDEKSVRPESGDRPIRRFLVVLIVLPVIEPHMRKRQRALIEAAREAPSASTRAAYAAASLAPLPSASPAMRAYVTAGTTDGTVTDFIAAAAEGASLHPRSSTAASPRPTRRASSPWRPSQYGHWFTELTATMIA